MHPHDTQPVLTAGVPLAEAGAAMILVHGRGATAASILELAGELPHTAMAYLAPQAAGSTWYPYSFLNPIESNQPGLDSGLAVLAGLVARVEAADIPADRLVFAGFSQGACLAAEFVARHPRRYGGLIVFSGGLIGPPGAPFEHQGDLEGMPIFIGCSDVDFHIPLERVKETTAVFTRLGGQVTERIYHNMGHTVNGDEIEHARQLLATLG